VSAIESENRYVYGYVQRQNDNDVSKREGGLLKPRRVGVARVVAVRRICLSSYILVSRISGLEVK
jgi:hypothetical protein